MRKNEKWLLWAIAHFGVAYLVASVLKQRGKSNQEAQLIGHAAGGFAGWLVLNSF